MEIKNKKIWLVNYYSMPPKHESRLRTIKFAHYLKLLGFEVTIIAGSFMHNTDINLITDKSEYIRKNYDDLNFIHIKTNSYKDNGIARMQSLFAFHFKLLKLARKFDKPDTIIHTAYIPFGNIFYLYAKKIKAQYIVEVVDLWPESFASFGLIKKNNPLMKFAYLSEKWLYKKADKVVFSMEGGADYIKDKKWDNLQGGPIDLKKIHYINNGVDLTDFEYFKNNFTLNDLDLENSEIFKVIYLGSVRLVNNVKALIDAAALLKNYPKIQFYIYGDGGDREQLEEYCKKKQIANVTFKEKWVKPKFVPYILSHSSLNILNYKRNDVMYYGGSQSKLFQYLASGQPICSNLRMNYCLINKFNLGIAKEFDSEQEYAKAILSLVNLSAVERNEMRDRASKVIKDFNYYTLTLKMAYLIQN